MDGQQTKRKLYLHIGTPKTGTSSIQFFLYNNYERLLEKGILYPKSIVESAENPKQQPLFSSVHSGRADSLKLVLDRMSAEIVPSVRSVIISSEGFYHHTDEFSERSWQLIRQIGSVYDLHIIVYLRPQADYLESMYRQYMKNPKGINPEYGSSMTILELMDRPKLKQNLDYFDSLMKWSDAAGDDRLVIRRYSGNVIEDISSLLGPGDGLDRRSTVRNASITRKMAEVLRRINPHLDNSRRNILIRQMEDYLSWSPDKDDMTILSPDERMRIQESYRECNTAVSNRWLHGEGLFDEHSPGSAGLWEPMKMDNEEMVSFLRMIGEKN